MNRLRRRILRRRFGALTGVTLATHDGRVLRRSIAATYRGSRRLSGGTGIFLGGGRRFMVSSVASVSPSDRVDLSVQVGALRLANPIITASGTFGYGVEFAHLVDLNRLGGFVTKGISREPMEGAPAPRLRETASGMLNAVDFRTLGSTRSSKISCHCCGNTTRTS